MKDASASPVVFLGPTLPLAEARRLLPDARFAPPVRCGSLLALGRLQPPVHVQDVAIIDGCFESVAAVWHKEILWALRRGMRVYGAASMGALRAAELADLGMRGVGEIFEGYRSGRIVDDDEVAVLHGPAERDYAPLTDALVNVRATLHSAKNAGTLNAAEAARILEVARTTFYQRRVLVEQLPDDEPLALVDQKRLDAIALLKLLAADDPQPAEGTPHPDAARASDTIFLRTLQCHAACRPFPFHATWLPFGERMGRRSRLFGLRYVLVRELALAMALLDACARARQRNPEAELRRGITNNPAACRQIATEILRYHGLYPLAEGRPQTDAILANVMPLSSAWYVLDEYLREAGDTQAADSQDILNFSRQQLASWGLSAQAQFDAWRQRNDLLQGRDHLQFWQIMQRYMARLSPYALSRYGCFRVDSDRAWLLGAMGLSGFGEELRRRSSDDTQRAELRRELAGAWESAAAGREAQALSCDFDGEADVQAELALL